MPYTKVSGVNLYYEEHGDAASTEVVAFFNGVMASTASWAAICPVFVRACHGDV